ncbi:sensor domain-containing diguanylate cyclase [Pseudomonas sp. TCU-HL1]|uniref:sensor domain-containing diguanylate cyclase n=1 Tax=Pseudomonas sp. TCU-HL1 TaxID=1856685 RepID=UPI00083DD7BE|nr:diguanylate cyclase [Pseudomonas sp. TCU-HL1]AOE84317.1 diguanylate cyclase [Pseudomonas sp. TCU-HL1]
MQLPSSSSAPRGASEERFDNLIRLLRRRFGVMATLLTTGAGDIQQVRSYDGPACAPALPDGLVLFPPGIRGADPLVMPDILQQPHWYPDGLAQALPGLRFLAACPLLVPDGGPTGLLWLLHDQPRDLDVEGQQVLRDFAALAAGMLADRLKLKHVQEREERMALAISGSGTGIWDRNAVTGEIHYSSDWKALLGYADNEVGNRIEESYTRIHPEDLAYVQATIQAHFDGRTEAYEVEHRLRCRDGRYKWVCSRGKVVERDESGRPLRMVGTTTDVTAMRNLAEKAQQAAALMADLTNEIPGMVFQYRRQLDGRSFFTYVSNGAREIYGVTPEQLTQDADTLLGIIHPDDLLVYFDSLERSARDLKPWHLEYRVQLPGRGLSWRQGDARPRPLADGSVLWHGFITDVTERKLIEAELQVFATTDSLTQLSNRRHFMTQLDAELARVQRTEGYGAAILMFDLDHFKAINDRWGHSVGDQALRHFSSILRAQLRRTDAAGRMGGEEFAVVLSNASIEEARLFAERVQGELASSPVVHGDERLVLAVSVGVATLLPADSSGEVALSRCDMALYRAKRGGRNRVECH